MTVRRTLAEIQAALREEQAALAEERERGELEEVKVEVKSGKAKPERLRDYLAKEKKRLQHQLAEAKAALDGELELAKQFRVVVPRGWVKPPSRREIALALSENELTKLVRLAEAAKLTVDPFLGDEEPDVALHTYLRLCLELYDERRPLDEMRNGSSKRLVDEAVEREAAAKERRKESMEQAVAPTSRSRRELTMADAKAWAKVTKQDVAFVIEHDRDYQHLRSQL